MKLLDLKPAAVVCAVVAAFSFGCSKEVKAPRAAQTVPVQTAVAVLRDLPVVQSAIGTVQALRTVGVKSQVDGVIAEIHFQEGNEVGVGDLLVSIDRRPFENSVRSAEAELANARAQAVQAEADEERYRTLVEQMTVSKEQYSQFHARAESARAAVQGREAALANAKLQLSYTELRAPIAGRTGQLNLHEGALVRANDAGQPILTINQLAPIFVAYSVPESLLPAVRGARSSGIVKVTLPPQGGRLDAIEGKLDFIDNTVDPTTGTILLKAVFENEQRRLWPGEFVEVTTRVGEDKDAVIVPATAVQTGQRGSQVFVVKGDSTVELRTVKIGRQTENEVNIAEGIRPGEIVVTDGQLRLVPGAKVENRTPAPAAANVAVAAEERAAVPASKVP